MDNDIKLLDHSDPAQEDRSQESSSRQGQQPFQNVPGQGPPPAYSFLNQNAQELASRTEGCPELGSIMIVGNDQRNGPEPPPPYPFVGEEDQVPTIQNTPAAQQEFPSLVDLLGSSNEFSLKAHSALACCPDFTITPLNTAVGLALPEAHNQIKCTTSSKGCISCCLPSASAWQTVSFLKHQADEKLNFIYKPKAWFGACGKDRVVDIYIPERNERIGWIKFNGDFREGALVFNALTNELFQSRRVELDQSPLALTMVNSVGLPVAIAQATSGVRYRGFTTWKTFRMAVSPITVKTRDTRAILLVAFTIWIIAYKEKTARNRLLYILFCIGLGVLIGFGLPLILGS